MHLAIGAPPGQNVTKRKGPGMELEGTKIIRADRATVWARLNDPAMLRAAIPGCTELTGSADDGFEAVVVQKVGPVKATFKGAVTLTDVNAPESYRIVGEGKGGVAGFAKGAAEVRLTEVPEGTELTYKVDAQVGGKLAQLGNRIVGGFARKMADEFFERFVTDIEGGGAA
jgi:carbon monoxide dehydrogenase subunit G